MPSRRACLATLAAASGAAVAGCSAITGPPGVDATIRGRIPDLPAAESAPIVARTRARADGDGDGCPEGILRAGTRVHEVTRGGRVEYVAVSEYDIITGESACSSGWGKAGLAARHDWRLARNHDGTVRARSDVVPAGEDESRQATLERRHTATRGRWHVHLTPPNRSTGTFHFVSRLPAVEVPPDGSVLLATRGRAQVRKGWVGGRDELRTTTALRYGRTDR